MGVIYSRVILLIGRVYNRSIINATKNTLIWWWIMIIPKPIEKHLQSLWMERRRRAIISSTIFLPCWKLNRCNEIGFIGGQWSAYCKRMPPNKCHDIYKTLFSIFPTGESIFYLICVKFHLAHSLILLKSVFMGWKAKLANANFQLAKLNKMATTKWPQIFSHLNSQLFIGRRFQSCLK